MSGPGTAGTTGAGTAALPGSGGVGSGGAAPAASGSGGTTAGGSGGSGSSASDAGTDAAVNVGPVADVPWVQGTCSTPPDTLNFETAELCVRLTKSSQTIAALEPKVAPGFDFTPADLRPTRSGPGYVQLGDITLRVRTGSSGDWQNIDSWSTRTAVTAMPASGSVMAAADLGPSLPASVPLSVTRSWVTEGGRLIMRLTLTNKSSTAVQVGALGLPMVFNNVLTNRTLEQAHATCSFADPYIGRDAGYVQVTRLNGQGPVLLVLPDGNTPFEAYNPIWSPPKSGNQDPVAIFSDLTQRSTTFEGFLEWMVHTKAYADKEWNAATPWNPPTELDLAPGESKTYGLQLVLADQVRHIEQVLVANQRPVAVGIPGYVLPMDLEGKLFLDYPWPVQSIAVEPADAIAVTAQAPATSGWKSYSLAGKAWGRARLSVTYANGTVQTIHYYVTKPASQVVSDLGSFLTTKAWYVDASDPFGRSPSVMTYDHEAGKSVTQDRRVWVAGLGDDGGATWLAGAMKLLGQPDAAQVAQYQTFIDNVIWGGLQYKDGTQQYGVKRSLFYYEPTQMPGYYDSNIPWIDSTTGQTYWGAWSRAYSLQTLRSYNYPHVAALYWVMYRLARNYTGLVTNHPWDWYLNQAYQTIVAMTTIGTDYAKYGLMDGTVFLEILNDLKREGLTQQANDLESRMHARENVWKTQSYPFGSEMPWDSTGQEEVYDWTRYFGDTDEAKVCVDAVTAYVPAVPHWAYNGCARRYWDFIYGGAKIDRLERMIHHYGSSLNATVLLSDFRDHPDDTYLLRIGYAGMMGSLTNIDQDGFPSMAFHSFPDTLRWDPVSGDYGLSFFGHAENTGTYLIDDPDFGWQAFGGNVSVSGTSVQVTVLDSMRKRVYLAPVGLWLTLDAGQFQSVTYDTQSHAVQVSLAPADANTSVARLRVEQPAKTLPMDLQVSTYAASGSLSKERDCYVVPLGAAPATVDLAP